MSDEVELRMDSASEAAAEALSQQGFRVATKPLEKKIPRLPKNLTDMNDEALMDRFVVTTSWVDYLSVQVACAQVDERAAQKGVDRAEAFALKEASIGSKSVSETKAKANSDERVIEAHEKLDDRHAYRKLIEVLAGNLERDASLLSRELTRRTSSLTPTQRAGRRV